MKNIFLCMLSLCLIHISSLANANWSWGIGYHNPPNASLGVNFMHLWSNWALELGIGYLGSNEINSQNLQTNSNTTSNSEFYAGGDLNLKYLFSSGFFRPYVQAGFGTALSLGNNNNNDNNTAANAYLNGSFGGAGFFLYGSEFYVYLSYLTSSNGTLQLGVGFN